MQPRYHEIERSNWRSIDVESRVLTAKSLLSAEERKFLFYLAREYFSGSGSIIDAGAFLGGSTLALAKGLSKNSRQIQSLPRIHSYDQFIVSPALQDFLRTYFRINKEIGSSFRYEFNKQIEECESRLVVHEGDILEETWSNSPIEILFIDVCKSRAINSHVVKQFFGSLIPGVTLIVHQDYHHPYHTWIHVTMEYLSDFFEIIEQKIDGSMVFGLRKSISQPRLDQCVAYAFSADEQISLMDAAIDPHRCAPAGTTDSKTKTPACQAADQGGVLWGSRLAV